MQKTSDRFMITLDNFFFLKTSLGFSVQSPGVAAEYTLFWKFSQLFTYQRNHCRGRCDWFV